MGQAVMLHVGARFVFDGELVEVVQLEGTRVVLRDAQGRWRTLGLAEFLVGAAALPLTDASAPALPEVALGPHLAGLTQAQRAELTERADHVREALSGYRSGSAQAARPGEPRADYDPKLPLRDRYQAKARELGVAARTVERWVRAYRAAGEAGLLDARKITSRGSSVDPRWEQTCRLVVAEHVGASTPTAGALLARVDARLDEVYGPGVVPRPSQATAYRQLARLTRGTGAVDGSAKARRSIAERPKGVYGRLRAVRPGEYVILTPSRWMCSRWSRSPAGGCRPSSPSPRTCSPAASWGCGSLRCRPRPRMSPECSTRPSRRRSRPRGGQPRRAGPTTECRSIWCSPRRWSSRMVRLPGGWQGCRSARRRPWSSTTARCLCPPT